MKKTLIFITMLLTYYNSCGQAVKKDTLFFKFKNTYVNTYKNYENVYTFTFKNEKLVTSAFGDRIVKENLFYFVGSNFFTFNGKKKCNLKKYFKKKREILKDPKTKKYDSYRIMQYFNKYIVFFLVGNRYVKVKAVASLGE